MPRDLGLLAIAYYHTSNGTKVNNLINSLQSLSQANPAGSPSYYLAMVYAQMGEINTSFEWLEKAYLEREVEMYWLMVEPPFKPLHDDPRWKELLNKVGFNVPVKG